MMKRLLVMVIVCVLAGAASLYAQDRLYLNVPFEFTTVNGTLPAGEYMIRMYPQGRVLISGQQGQGAVWVLGYSAMRMVIAEVITKWQPGAGGGAANTQKNRKDSATSRRGGGSGENCAVFSKYGDQYFLHEAWIGYAGRHMTASKAEHAIQTAGIVKPEKLELAALVR
jgi:hypothetical protein